MFRVTSVQDLAKILGHSQPIAQRAKPEARIGLPQRQESNLFGKVNRDFFAQNKPALFKLNGSRHAKKIEARMRDEDADEAGTGGVVFERKSKEVKDDTGRVDDSAAYPDELDTKHNELEEDHVTSSLARAQSVPTTELDPTAVLSARLESLPSESVAPSIAAQHAVQLVDELHGVHAEREELASRVVDADTKRITAENKLAETQAQAQARDAEAARLANEGVDAPVSRKSKSKIFEKRLEKIIDTFKYTKRSLDEVPPVFNAKYRFTVIDDGDVSKDNQKNLILRLTKDYGVGASNAARIADLADANRKVEIPVHEIIALPNNAKLTIIGHPIKQPVINKKIENATDSKAAELIGAGRASDTEETADDDTVEAADEEVELEKEDDYSYLEETLDDHKAGVAQLPQAAAAEPAAISPVENVVQARPAPSPLVRAVRASKAIKASGQKTTKRLKK